MRIYTYKFNNYRNRIYKAVYDVTSMLPYRTNGQGWETSNFNYGDKITTTQIVGSLEQPYSEESDYCILQQDDGTIMKWFILEAHYVRGYQWQLTLRRDFGDEIFNVDCIIHRGYVPDSSNRIFNSEPLSFNKILKARENVTDKSVSPWYVAYVAKDWRPDGDQITFFYNGIDPDITVAGLSNWEYYDNIGENVQLSYSHFGVNVRDFFDITTTLSAHIAGVYSLQNRATRGIIPYLEGMLGLDGLHLSASHNIRDTAERLVSYGPFARSYDTVLAARSYINLDKVYELTRLNGKYLFDSRTNKTFAMSVTVNPFVTERITPSEFSSVFMDARQMLKNEGYLADFGKTSEANMDTNWAFAEIETRSVTLSLTEVPYATGTDHIPIPTSRNRTDSSAYDIIAFPAHEVKLGISSDTTNRIKANALAGYFASLPQDVVYDIQLLPFSPINDKYLTTRQNGIGRVRTDLMVINVDDVQNTDTTTGYLQVFFVRNAQCYHRLQCELREGASPYFITKKKGGYKRVALCDMWRLNSPNMASTFEFNAAEMDGWGSFYAEMEFKPATPYVQVYMDFKRLYGTRFQDMRGLICSGEFSLSRTSSEWNEYVLRNKNYQLQFNREIDNLSLTQSVERKQQIANAMIGGLSSTVQAGVSAGMATGNPIVGVAAGAVMAGANVAGAALDVKWSEQLRQEAQNFKKDMFNLSMENIKAVPATLTNVSPRTPRNNGFVTIEYYTCSEEEVDTLLNYIRWYGMSVEAVGRVQDWLEQGVETFVSATILRYDGIEDSHYVNALNEELERGFYIRRNI